MSWGVSEWELGFLVVNTAGTIVLAVMMLYLRSVFVTHKEHNELKGRVERHSERLNSGDSRFNLLDMRMKGLPTNETMGQLSLTMSHVEGKIGVLTAQLDGMAQLHKTLERQVQVMDEFLLRERRA